MNMFRTAKRIEAHRRDALSSIRAERLAFEQMVQRARVIEGQPDDEFVSGVLNRLDQIHKTASQETNVKEMGDLVEDAEEQAQLRAYICPLSEIAIEGGLCIDVIEEWGVAKSYVEKLRDTLEARLLVSDEKTARGTLRTIYEEYDSWSRYTDEYDDAMRQYSRWLFFASIVLIIASMFALRHPATMLLGLLSSGAAGSCVSVMAKMPIMEVSPSGELELFLPRLLTRIGVGIVASLIGSALLGWGILPIAIHGQTFGDAFNACAGLTPCNMLETAILLGVPMLFGFSERALTSFEHRILG